MTEETKTNASGGDLVLVNPQGSLEKSMQLFAYINARRDEVLAQIEAAEKEGAVDVCWATAQSDAACDEIAAWFKANA